MNFIIGLFWGLSLVGVPITFGVFIVRAIIKKSLKKTGIVLFSFVIIFILSTIYILHDAQKNGINVEQNNVTEDTQTESQQSQQTVEEDSSEKENSSEKEENQVQSNHEENEVFNIPSEQLATIDEIDIADTQVFDELIRIGYTEQNATEIEKVLKTIGVDSFQVDVLPSTDPNEGLCPIVGYPNGYTDSNRRCFFTTDNGVVFYAAFGNEDLYDSDKGGFLKDYGDVYVPETKVSIEIGNQLQQLAKEQVKLNLNYSNSANFGAFDWAYGREDDKYMVVGVVTAENAFAVKSDIRFTVWFIEKDDTFVVEGVAFDGIRVQ